MRQVHKSLTVIADNFCKAPHGLSAHFPPGVRNCSWSRWWERLKLEIGWAQNYEALRTSLESIWGLGVGLARG